ncbi:hypothetical protein DNH61_07220 [Paenibacillus sambharensis]|uniref:HTH HARE-type domain-containing protein n=1 Tax=Paenibacillus sambharensis TaxID=1803190 RepID=A0A2W1LY09_9BACL|nr:hypothetical protein [Paenibacillus sambharensis]PZD96581.1 hypothetical protein DNH61_07220 [Paenibacillus sambharensis]
MKESLPTKKRKIVNSAIELLLHRPEGMRFSELKKKINEQHFEIGNSTIGSTIVSLEQETKGTIVKVDKGLFKHSSYVDNQSLGNEGSVVIPNTEVTEREREEKFYAPFADWLTDDIEECTHAIPLGGKRFKDKWGTPDVIGIRESRRGAVIQFPIEIVAAEIKVETRDLITAFGQASAYKLFCHKSYIVIPNYADKADIARLDGLCRISGIGLILFDYKNSDNPNFEIRVRANKNEPDMFYVDKYINLIEDDLFPRNQKRR